MNTIQKGEFAQLLYSGESTVRFEEEITLPDYCPDITRLIRVDMTPVFEKSRAYLQDGAINTELDGRAEYTLIYTDDSGACETYSFSGDFSAALKKDIGKKQSVSGDSMMFFVNPVSHTSSAKPMSARKILVRGEVKVSCEAFANVEYSVYDPTGDSAAKRVETDMSRRDIAICISSSEEDFTLSQEVKLPPTLPSCAKLLSCTASVSVDSCHPSQDSVAVFMTAGFNVFYLSEESEDRAGEYVSFYQPIEIRENIACDDCAEDAVCRVRARVGRAVCDVECDNFGENRIFRLSLPYTVKCAVFENVETGLVFDAYGVGCKAECVNSTGNFMKYVGALSETVPFREKVLIKTSAQDVCGIKGNARVKEASVDENGAFANVLIEVSGIRKEEGALAGGFGEELELRIPLNLPDSVLSKVPSAKLWCDAAATLSFVDAQATGETLEVSGELLLRAQLWEKDECRYVSDVQFTEIEKTSAKTVFYYPTPSDTLWSVGARYGVSLERLAELNGIENGTLPTVCKIFDGN